MALENLSPDTFKINYERSCFELPERYFTESKPDSDIDELIQMMARLTLDEPQPEFQRGIKRKCAWEAVQDDEKRQKITHEYTSCCKKRTFDQVEHVLPLAKRIRVQ